MNQPLIGQSSRMPRGIGLFVWLPGLIALQSIPGTGALRTLFLLIGVIHVWISFRGARTAGPSFSWSLVGAEGVLFALLSSWLVLQSAYLANAPTAALSALASEWGRLMLMAGVGMAVAARFGQSHISTLMAAVFAGYFLHVLSTLGLQISSVARGGGLIFKDSLMGNMGYVSPFTTAAFALLLADGMSRFRHGERLLPLSPVAWIAALLATLTAETLLHSKAGQLMSAFLVLVCLPLLMGPAKISRRWVMLGGIAVLSLAVLAGLAAGNRWKEIAGDTWSAISQEEDIRSISGSDVENAAVLEKLSSSFYVRTIWARTGLSGIAQHPLGMGYGIDAFGRYVNERYGLPGMISSHSGWIDFALANGIPGLVLLLGLALAMMRRGWRAFRAGSPAGLALMLITFHYIVRCAIDGNLAGSRLTGFAFTAGVLWYLTLRGRREIPAA